MARRVAIEVIVLLHILFVGYALKAGFAYYIEHDQGKFDGVITLSANVRFPVQSVEKIAEALREERTKGTHALVLGSSIWLYF